MTLALLVGRWGRQVTRKKNEVRFLPRHQASSGVKLRWYQSGKEVNTGWEHYDFSQGRSSPTGSMWGFPGCRRQDKGRRNDLQQHQKLQTQNPSNLILKKRSHRVTGTNPSTQRCDQSLLASSLQHLSEKQMLLCFFGSSWEQKISSVKYKGETL